MTDTAMAVLVGVSVALTAVSLLWVGLAIKKFDSQRVASCKATLSALADIAETSAAGIRPTVDRIPTDISPQLAASFRMQLQATKAENARRRAVIVRSKGTAARLKASKFCN